MTTENYKFSFDKSIFMRNPMFDFKHKNTPYNQLSLNLKKIYDEAIYIASVDLYEELQNINDSDKTKNIEKISNTLYKYSARMATRCTPFGLFSTISEVLWSDETKQAALSYDIKKSLRLDMTSIHGLLLCIERDPNILNLLIYKPNNSLYQVNDELRYIDYQKSVGFLKHRISKVKFDYIIKMILEKSKSGIEYSSLVNLLTDEGYNVAESDEYVRSLLNENILTSELNLKITSKNTFQTLLQQLYKVYERTKSKYVHEVYEKIEVISRLINDLDKSNAVGSYKKIADTLTAIIPNENQKRLIQVDAVRENVNGTLDKKHQESLFDAVRLIAKLSTASYSSKVSDFANAFNARYEGQTVSLSEAVDGEIGIGYPINEKRFKSDLTSGVAIKENPNLNNISLNKVEQFLLKKIIEQQTSKEKAIVIQPHETTQFEDNFDIIPESTGIFFNLLYNDQKESFIHIKGISNKTASSMIGRFSHADVFVEKMLNRINNHEKDFHKNHLTAEIVHLPSIVRLGNILTRSHSRDYEISYLSEGIVDQENQLFMSDLYLKMQNSKVMVFSKSKNRRVIPYLSSAQNYRKNTLPAYELLCDLQNDGNHHINFSWGNLIRMFSYFPRVIYKNIILSVETWIFVTDQINLINSNDIQLWAAKHNIPRSFLLVEDDNELLIDLEDNKSILIFLNTVKKKSSFIIKESLFNNENVNFAVSSESNLGFSNEMLATLFKSKTGKDDFHNIPEFKSTNIQGSFMPGEEWLYYKYYCDPSVSNIILDNHILPIVKKLLKLGLIDSYFFIRYGDPDYHLRVRFKLKQPKYLYEVMESVTKSAKVFVKRKLIRKMQIDTYEREIQRYGAHTIALVENLFFYDSTFNLNVQKKSEIEDHKWFCLIYSIDQLLTIAKFTVLEKKQLLDFLRQGFYNEHSKGKETKIQLDTRYRTYKNSIQNILNRQSKDFNDLFDSDIKEYSNKLKLVMPDLLKSLVKDKLNKFKFFGDLIHMMNNRTFVANQRTHEFVIYYMLSKYYLTNSILNSTHN